MIKKFTLLLCLFCGYQSQAQEYPSFTEIEKQVSDSTKSTYYPVLLKRFNDFDTTLTRNEFILLYYGFGFQDGYNGYRKEPTNMYYAMWGKKQYAEILAKCDSVLKEIPVCIASNLYRGKAMRELYPDSAKATYRGYIERSFKLSDVLINSGDGESYKTSYKVLFLSDEKRVMYGTLNLEGYSKQALSQNHDILTVKKSDKYRKTEIYFNVYLPLTGLSREFQKFNVKDKK